MEKMFVFVALLEVLCAVSLLANENITSGYQADTDMKRPNLTSLSQRKSESLTETMDVVYNYKNDDQAIDIEKIYNEDENDYSLVKKMLMLMLHVNAHTHATLNSKPDPKNMDYENAGSLNSSLSETVPVFKNMEKMYAFNVKPAGGFIKFKCQATGNPTPNITWLINNKIPKRASGTILYSRWGIQLKDLVTTDIGNYTCTACNIKGCINFTRKLDVIERYPSKPYIKEGFPGNKTVLVNSTVQFHCPPKSDLEPHIEWLKVSNLTLDDDETIPNGTKIKALSDNPSILELTNVTLENEGWYICIAENSLGYTFAKAYLNIVESYDTSEIFQEKQFIFIKIILGTIFGTTFTIFSVGFILYLCVLKKIKRRNLRNRLSEETSKVLIVHWTKRIIIEKTIMENNKGDTVSKPLIFPTVKIEKQKFSKVEDENITNPMMVPEYELPLDSDWELPREIFTLGKVLGEGEFGKVVIAEGNGLLKKGVVSTVAIKMLKKSHSDIEIVALVSEMEIMKMIGKHINIINLLGCCTQGGPLYVIIEYAPHGNLREFLRSHRTGNEYEPTGGINDSIVEKKTLTKKDLISFSYQVARGMEYLTSQRCIHRDLAARNVLVSDDFVLKIADFGLAKDVQSNEYYRKKTEGQLPIRWMAPESLYHKLFTTKTDVWSFGVLLWEIMTFGSTPYPTVPGQFLLKHISAGNRLEKPPCCSIEIYMLMRGCWSFNPSERLSFSELVEKLDGMLSITANHEYLDLELPQLDTPPSSYNSSADSEPIF